MAKYNTLPNYEIIRPKLHIQFDSQGNFETSDAKLIEYLDDKVPFIQRVDKPEQKPATKRSTNKK